jgi:SAM-dependent methyltransferase
VGHYGERFFANMSSDSARSAAVTVPLLVDAIRPSSVIDVGCGVGTWLAAVRSAGVEDVLGIDGDYVAPRLLQIPPQVFRAADLNESLMVDRQFDLAICLEVAEHLKPERSESLVEELVGLAPAVCFGAAIPLQGGTGHINERWQDDWAGMFAKHHYRVVDLLRPKIWDCPEVQPWYAQNTLLYISGDVELSCATEMPLRVVHPRTYEDRLTRTLGPREVLRHARRTARERLRR